MLLFAHVLSLTEEDRLVWNADPSGMFSVKYANEWLTLSYGPMVKLPDLIWKNISSPKMQFISWLAWKVKLKTSAFLQNIGVLDQNACTLCIFCRSEIETGMCYCTVVLSGKFGQKHCYGVVFNGSYLAPLVFY